MTAPVDVAGRRAVALLEPGPRRRDLVARSVTVLRTAHRVVGWRASSGSRLHAHRYLVALVLVDGEDRARWIAAERIDGWPRRRRRRPASQPATPQSTRGVQR